MKRVSVIIPAFQSEKTLRECLDSVLAQDYPNMELIVIDDASFDATPRILLEYSTRYQSVKPITLTENQGVHGARQAGVLASTGDILFFVDSDDWMGNGMVSIMVGVLEDTQADIAICGVNTCNEQRKTMSKRVAFPKMEVHERNIFQTYCNRGFGTTSLWNKAYRRKTIERNAAMDFGWRADAVEDTLVNIGCFHDARKVALLPHHLYLYRQHAGSATALSDYGKTFARLLRAYASAVTLLENPSEEDLKHIDRLYRVPLLAHGAKVRHASELDAYAGLMDEAVTLLSETRPQALWRIMCAGIDSPNPGYAGQGLTRQWLHLHAKLIRRVIKILRGNRP